MNKLKRLALATIFAVLLAGTALAGEIKTSPCTNPGEVESPPCSTTPYVNDEFDEASPDVSGEIETLFFEAASDAVEKLLILF